MKQHTIRIGFKAYDNLEELTEMQAKLVRKAIQASAFAYAPYSKYHVGAAVLLANGEVITGNNQENAAYPSGMCAERVAIFYAGSQYPDVPATSMAIVASQEGSIHQEPVTPCGGCRQVLCEAESKSGVPLELILYGSDKIQVFQRASDLLPLPFSLNTGNISILG